MRASKIPFYKMNGCGNDFIVIDNRRNQIADDHLREFVTGVCRRRLSVGADGLILIERGRRADFSWRFFNSDGSRAEMCGNGARCAARFAAMTAIAPEQMRFETDAGTVHALVSGESVRVGMPDPSELQLDLRIELASGPALLSFVNTGVPHAVTVCERIEDIDVPTRGRELRYHPEFAPDGTNANFICREGRSAIAVRTYERGVEDETLACGTGCIAGALVAAAKMGMASPVAVRTRSGSFLTIHFDAGESGFREVHLEGDARIVSSGEIWPQAWR